MKVQIQDVKTGALRGKMERDLIYLHPQYKEVELEVKKEAPKKAPVKRKAAVKKETKE